MSHGQKTSRGQRKSLVGKEKVSWQRKMSHAARNCLAPKENFSQKVKENKKFLLGKN